MHIANSLKTHHISRITAIYLFCTLRFLNRVFVGCFNNLIFSAMRLSIEFHSRLIINSPTTSTFISQYRTYDKKYILHWYVYCMCIRVRKTNIENMQPYFREKEKMCTHGMRDVYHQWCGHIDLRQYLGEFTFLQF